MMSILRDAWQRVVYFVRGASEADELREEMEHHIEMETAAFERAGMSHEEAVRAARAKFGSADRFAEETRDASGAGFLLDFWQDIRHALRGLRRTPGFAAVSILTLAVGIGVATVVFSIADHLVYRPIPGVRAQHELTTIHVGAQDIWNFAGMSATNLADMAAATPALSSMAAYQPSMSLQAALGDGPAESLLGHAIIGDYFGTLGVRAARGRLFSKAEMDGSGDSHVVVISHELWRRAFHSEPVTGKRIRLNAGTYTIIGVAPPGFVGPRRTDRTDLWVPGAAYTELRHYGTRGLSFTDRGADMFNETFGRLAPGATMAQALEQLQRVTRGLIDQYPEATEQFTNGPVEVYAVTGLRPGEEEGVRRVVKLLVLIASFVLLVTCANVANLLLFRAVTMRGESAIRRALGATAARLYQHHIAQGAVFGVLASIVGIILGAGILALLADTGLPGLGKLERVTVDQRVMLFAAALGLLTSIVFATVPTALARRLRLTEVLQSASRTETGRLVWLRRGLVVTQLALAAALVVPGVMLANSVRNLAGIDIGIDTKGLMQFGIATEPQGYDADAALRLNEYLLAEIRKQPGIVSVALSNGDLLSEGGFFQSIRGPMQGPDGEETRMNGVGISRDFFSTIGMSLEEGRSFDASDDNTPADRLTDGIVLNRTAARKLFGDAQALGGRVRARGVKEELRVIGIVEDTRLFGLRAEPRPAAYRPVSEQAWRGSVSIVVRSQMSAEKTQQIVGDVVKGFDPNIPFYRVQTMTDIINDTIARERLFARLATILASLAAILAAVGLYGLMAYSVVRRWREIGIRMALGARRSSIIGAVTGEALAFALAGSILGWFGGVMLTGMLRTMLFGIEPLDMRVYIATAFLFIMVAIVSAVMPARTAAGIQPASALRTE